MEPLTTGEIAERTGVSRHTVRYYEERGLLPEPPRTGAGYRQYGPEHIRHIRFIKRAQKLGFTLKEINELLSLRTEPQAGTNVRQQTREKIAEIDQKVEDLTRIRRKLAELEKACAEHGSPSDCRILHALEDR